MALAAAKCEGGHHYPTQCRSKNRGGWAAECQLSRCSICQPPGWTECGLLEAFDSQAKLARNAPCSGKSVRCKGGGGATRPPRAPPARTRVPGTDPRPARSATRDAGALSWDEYIRRFLPPRGRGMRQQRARRLVQLVYSSLLQ